MTNWIDEEKQKYIQSERERELYQLYRKPFSDLAWLYWDTLMTVVDRDIEKMNIEMQTLLGCEVTRAKEGPGEITINKPTYPSHFVIVVLDTKNQRILIEDKRAENMDRRSTTTQSLHLSLDDSLRNIVVTSGRQALSPEEVSELILRPLLS